MPRGTVEFGLTDSQMTLVEGVQTLSSVLADVIEPQDPGL
jgi:hypothetical protein